MTVEATKKPEGVLKSSARGDLDGGGFVGVQIDGDQQGEKKATLRFYAAGNVYVPNKVDHAVKVEKELHELEDGKFEMEARRIAGTKGK